MKTSEEVFSYLKSSESIYDLMLRINEISFVSDELPVNLKNSSNDKIKYLYRIFLILSTYIGSAPDIQSLLNPCRHIEPVSDINDMRQLLMNNAIPCQEMFFELFYLTESYEEMCGLLKFISFDRSMLPYDIQYDVAIFPGFLIRVFNKSQGTQRWEWFLEGLRETEHLKPLREQWYDYLKMCQLFKVLTGLEDRLEVRKK